MSGTTSIVRNPERRAIARTEILSTGACLLVLTAVVLPSLGRAREVGSIDESMVNLLTLGIAHALYAADWNDRQVTVIDDEIASFGSDATSAFQGFEAANGAHPSLVLGWGISPSSGGIGLWQYPQGAAFAGNHGLVQPVVFTGVFRGQGFHRLHNTRPFHFYLSGHFYEPAFYSPTDPAPWAVASPAFDDPWEWVFLDDIPTQFGDIPAYSSYSLSPAAMFDPAVMRRDDPSDPTANGWIDPFSIDTGFTSPSRSQILYPHLKTHVIEHNWNRHAPAQFCNPAYSVGLYGGCEPYYFNQGLASSPATLFYDLAVRELPNAEVVDADARLMGAVGYGLWSRDTPLGPEGYFGELGIGDVNVSHHVLTTDGAEGRDTIEGAAATDPRELDSRR